MDTFMKSDDVCARHADTPVSLTLRMLDAEAGEEPIVLIEGTPKALHMLAELLIAVADDPENDGFSMSPRGAGSIHFSADATFGFYIHRLDESEAKAD